MNQQMIQVRQLKLQAGAPAEVPPTLWPEGFPTQQDLWSYSTCSLFIEGLTTQINRAIISIIHVCSDVPRPKAASHVTHDFTLPQFLSFLLCSPQTQFSFIPWICKKLQRTCRKIQTVLEIVPVSNGREPWTLQVFLNTGRHLECAKKGGNQLPDGCYFCTERVGHGLKHHRVLTVLEQSQLITTWEMQQEKEPMSNVLRGRLLCLSLNTCWPGTAWHRWHQAHVRF